MIELSVLEPVLSQINITSQAKIDGTFLLISSLDYGRLGCQYETDNSLIMKVVDNHKIFYFFFISSFPNESRTSKTDFICSILLRYRCCILPLNIPLTSSSCNVWILLITLCIMYNLISFTICRSLLLLAESSCAVCLGRNLSIFRKNFSWYNKTGKLNNQNHCNGNERYKDIYLFIASLNVSH